MSIIHDALKKAQNSPDRNPPTNTTIPIPPNQADSPSASTNLQKDPPENPEGSTIKRSNPWFLIALTIAIISNAVILLLLFLQNNLTSTLFVPKQDQAPTEIVINKAEPPAQIIGSNPVEQDPSPPKTININPLENLSINIQGIMSTEQKNVALINNKIYEEGKILPDGIKILKITSEHVLIEKNGYEKEMPFNR
jgi:type II secretory pathway component PulC